MTKYVANYIGMHTVWSAAAVLGFIIIHDICNVVCIGGKGSSGIYLWLGLVFIFISWNWGIDNEPVIHLLR